MLRAADDKSGVKPTNISLPSGPGSIEGLGESFEPQLNSGTFSYRVPLQLPPIRGGAPALALEYSSGTGNGTTATAQNTRGLLAYVWDLTGEEHTSYDARGRVSYTVKRIRDPRFVSPLTSHPSPLISYRTGFTYDSLDRVMSDASGQLVSENAYYPFGHPRQEDQQRGLKESYQFTQKERDGETTLFYFEARYYVAGMSGFITVDPLASAFGIDWLRFPQKLNLYRYCLNNPVNLTDPTGLDGVSTTESTGATIELISSAAEAGKALASGNRQKACEVIGKGAIMFGAATRGAAAATAEMTPVCATTGPAAGACLAISGAVGGATLAASTEMTPGLEGAISKSCSLMIRGIDKATEGMTRAATSATETFKQAFSSLPTERIGPASAAPRNAPNPEPGPRPVLHAPSQPIQNLSALNPQPGPRPQPSTQP